MLSFLIKITKSFIELITQGFQIKTNSLKQKQYLLEL